MLKRLLRSRLGRPARARAGDALYALAVAQARQPVFYADMGVADRIDARFELYTLHVLILVLRLRDEGGEAGVESAQALFDTYVSALDHTLRELGVGDVSVGKKMRRLGESVYGRMTAYEGPLRQGDAAALSAALARNVLDSEDPTAGRALATYALASREALAAQAFASVVAAPAWAEPRP